MKIRFIKSVKSQTDYINKMTHTVTFGLCQFDHINPTVSVSVIAFNVETDQDNPGQ
jgi:hypothetical protein